jgi:GT2 family glycosyltransferase
MQNSDINIIENKENIGFTIACNQGIKISTGRYILFLNPDTEIIENSLELLYNKFQEENIYSAIVPKLLYKDGSIQFSCRTLPRYTDLFYEIFLFSYIFTKSKTFSRWKMNYFSHNEIAEVEQPMAAALLLKRTVLNEVQNFDESYYMFFNDVDLCKKMYDRNYKILFYPESRFIHKKGASIYKDRARMIKAWNSDCLNYFKKHHYSFLKYNLLKIFLKLTGSIRILFKL